jgi:hypothetical protein
MSDLARRGKRTGTSKRRQVLDLLRAAGTRGVTTAELLEAGVGARYSARLLELRREGHVIEAQRVRDGSWRYTLQEHAPTRVGAGNACAGDVGELEPLALFDAPPAEPPLNALLDWEAA